MFRLKKENGQVSRLLLVLAIVVLVAVAIVYLVMRMAQAPASPIEEPIGPSIPQPVYQATLGNIKFVFQDSQDLGSVLRSSAARKGSSWLKDITTTERFITVTVGAQNKGKINIPDRAWDIGDIVDSENRHFIPMESYTVDHWIPEGNSCGVLLEPEFDPVPCTKIYKVSKISTGLKINVRTGTDNNPSNLSSEKVEEAFLDLILN